MDFDLNPEQAAICQAAADFAKGEFNRRLALDCERSRRFPRELLEQCGRHGFLGIHYPVDYGGQGCGVLENALVAEAFCRQDSGLGIAISQADSCVEIILRHGSEAQKSRYLPALTTGAAICSGAFTEPDHGSDVRQIATTVSCVGDELVLNGSKMFITNGALADFVIVLCRVAPQTHPQRRTHTAVIVEKGTPGFSASEVGEKMGNRMASTAELRFDSVRVPRENIVGTAGQGFVQALELFDEVRIEIAAQALGVAQGAYDRAVAYLGERRQFGRKLEQFQALRHRVAEMLIRIETARMIVYKAAWLVDQGRRDTSLASIAKAYATRVAAEVADEAIQMHGGYGCMLEYEVERFYRDARMMEIYGGTREIQKNTIARQVLGSCAD